MANELEAIYSVLSNLRVQDLKDILRDVGDRVSGNKPALIDRLKDRLATARMSNPLQYKRLQDLINSNLPSHLRFQVNDSSLITGQHSNHPNSHVPSAAFPSTSSGLPPHSPLKIKISRPNTSSVPSPSSSRITETVPVEPGTAVPGPIPVSPFIESISSQYTGRIEWTNLSWRIQPFYEIVGIVAGKKFIAGRDTNFNFTFTPQQATLLREPSYRVVYLSTNIEAAIVGSRVLYRDNKQYRPCAFLDMMYVDRAFVNGTYVSDVPQKTKGLKKKFGTINPLDITRYCKIPHSQMNMMNLLYLGNSSFVGAVVIVRKKSVENVLKYIQDHKVMTKEERLEQIKQIDEDDDDVIATNSMISVKDPLSYTRIQVPIRNRSCRHLECFDAEMYLRMNEQTPTHTCPRCHQLFGSVSKFSIDNIMNVGPAFKKYLKEYDMSLDKLVGLNPFKDIVIDGYFMAVLKSIHDEDVDSFVVFPNGTWRLHKEEPIDDLDDDDEYGDRNSGMSNGKKEGSSQSVSSSRRNGPPADNPVVIDLTFDSDEEDVAPAPAPSVPAPSASVPPPSLTVADLLLRNSLSPIIQPTDTGGNRIGSIAVPPTSSRPSEPHSGQSSSATTSTNNTNPQTGMLSSTSTTRPSSILQNPPITTPPLPGLAPQPMSLPTTNVPSSVNGIQSSSFYLPGTLATSTLSSMLSPANGTANQTSYFQNPYPGQLGTGSRPGTIGSIPMTSPLLPYDPQNMALLSQQLNMQQRLADMQRAQRESSQSSLTGSSQPSISIPPPLTAPPRPVSSTAHNGIPLTAASSSTPTQPITTLPSINQVIYPAGSKRPREEDIADGHPSKRMGSMDSSISGGGGDTGSLNSSVRSGSSEQRRQDYQSSPPYRGGDRYIPSSSSSNSYRSRREDSGSSTGSNRDREWDRGRDRDQDRDGYRTNGRYWISNTDRERDRDRDRDRR